MEWNGTEWNGTEWNGIRWAGMGGVSVNWVLEGKGGGGDVRGRD